MILVDYPGHIIAGMLLTVFAVLVFFAFRCSELQKATRQSYKWPLIVIQYLAIVILLLILWNPSRSKVSEELSRNSVLAFFDTSESMSVVEEGQVNRLDWALNIFQNKFSPLDADSPTYKVFGFDRKTYHSGSSNFLRRWGSETDMHSLQSVLGKYDHSDEPAKENKVIGAVIFTDGQADDKNVRTYIPLNNKDFQIAIIGVGSRNRYTDIAIKSINAPSRIAVDTAGTIQVVVSARNLQNQPVTIELLKDDYVMDSKEIPAESFTKDRRRSNSLMKNVTTEFTIGAEGVGSYSYSIRAKALEHEVNLANNVRSMMVDVVEETRLKVLLYSQVANFDIGKLRQALVRDEKIELDLGLDVIRVPALAENLSKTYGYVGLPDDRREFNKYDIIILGPCEPDALTDAQITGLYSFVVDRGGGLILLPGKTEFGPAEWINKKVKALIPVIFDAGNPTIWPSSPGQIELTPEALESKVLDHGTLQDNDQPVSPYYRVTNPKPASTTLASIKETPIISIHRVGRGRVCLLNISRLFSLYREDIQGGLLYKMMAGLNAHMGRVTAREAGIELFAERVDGQKDKIKFEAYVCDNSFAPVAGANVLLNIRDEVLGMNQVEQGYYIVQVDDVHGQAIVATAQAELNGVFLGEKTVAVNLPPSKSEMTNIELDEKFLRELAVKLNGKYFYADDVSDDVGQMYEAQALIGSSRSITSVWPAWPLLLALCVILGVSWFLRHHWFGLKDKLANMKKIIIIILLAILSEWSSGEALDVERNAESKEKGKTYVLMISGINKNSKEGLAKDHAIMGLRSFLLDNAEVESDRLSFMVDRKSSVRKDSIVSTASNLKKQIDRFAAAVNTNDRFIFYYMGQANIVSDTLRLNLPGPDITDKQLAEWINGIKASSMLIVLDCPGAGLAVKAVTEPDRIIIGACTADQHYSTQFSEYFVPALIDEKSDTDEDGRISLLEAFTSASRSVDDFYRRQALLTTETPVLEDNADGIPSRQPWRYKQNKKDGLMASKFFLSVKG